MKLNADHTTMNNHHRHPLRDLPLPRLILSAALGLMLLLPATAPRVQAQAAGPNPPDLMSYQGFLVDANGVPLGNSSPANYDMIFKIYDAATGGTSLWGEQQTVTVDKGYFSIRLGQGTASGVKPALNTVFFGTTASDRYIGTTVKGLPAGEVEILPRQRLLPAPYAFAARNALSLDATTNVVMNEKELRFGSAADGNNFIGYRSDINGLFVVGKTGGNLSIPGKAILSWRDQKVGINKESPVEALDVTGNVKASGQFIGDGSRLTGVIATSATTATTATTANALNVSGPLFLNEQPLRLRFNGAPNTYIGYHSSLDGVDVVGQNGGNLAVPGQAILTWRRHDGIVGMVGINTETPRYPLDVRGVLNDTFRTPLNNVNGTPTPLSTYLFSFGLETRPINVDYTDAISIRADRGIVAGNFLALSDARIKEVVGRSDAAADLATLLRLQVTDYRKIDKIGQGNRLVKGFIAQEVEQIIPEAVSRLHSFIPDIYALATGVTHDAAKQTLTVTLGKDHGLKVAERVRLILESGPQEFAVVRVESPRQFTVGGCAKAAAKAFVYGREVDDFRSVDYDRLFTTSISAVQGLARRVESLEQREARVAELEQKAVRVATLEQEVAELKKLVRQIAARQGEVRQVSAK